MHGNSARGNRETPSTPIVQIAAGRLEKAMSQKSNMHVGGESDGCVVPMKCSNRSGQPLAESMEGRRPAKENIGQATAPRTQSRIGELSDLNGVRKVAREGKRNRFNPRFLAFARECGFIPRACHVRAAWEKGKVERAIGYVRQNFWPLRSFTDLADVNANRPCMRLQLRYSPFVLNRSYSPSIACSLKFGERYPEKLRISRLAIVRSRLASARLARAGLRSIHPSLGTGE
jgi:hypothetical protein